MEALAADGPRCGALHAGSIAGRGPQLKGIALARAAQRSPPPEHGEPGAV